MNVFILIHHEISAIYGCCDSMENAQKLLATFPNPDVLRILPLTVDNKMTFISAE